MQETKPQVNQLKINSNKSMKVKRSMERYSLQCSPLQNAFNAECQKLKGCASKSIFCQAFLKIFS